MLIPLLVPPDVKAALDEFESWGAVVDHVLFAAPVVVDGAAHEMAAKSGLEAVLEATQKCAPLWKMEKDLAKLQVERAQQATPQEFFGSHFLVETRQPLFRFGNSPYLHPLHDEANAHLRRGPLGHEEELAGDASSTLGYANAILHPPYGLGRPSSWLRKVRSLTPWELGNQFLELCEALFGELKTLEIWSWPTDCSNYFEPGLEWWGSSFGLFIRLPKTGSSRSWRAQPTKSNRASSKPSGNAPPRFRTRAIVR